VRLKYSLAKSDLQFSKPVNRIPGATKRLGTPPLLRGSLVARSLALG